jgi:hypothetical protein
VQGLASLDPRYGVEVDLRSYGSRVVVTHEAFEDGEDFESWIRGYRHAMLILNVKEEGLESAVYRSIASLDLSQTFLLDQSFPNFVREQQTWSKCSAVRVSDIESIETVKNVGHLLSPGWIWIDSFSGMWDHLEEALEAGKSLGFRTCLASPELHGREIPEEMLRLHEALQRSGKRLDAVCTKNLSDWEKYCEDLSL